MNLYVYVGNDPVNFLDPFGLQQWDIISSTEALHNGYQIPPVNWQEIGSQGSAVIDSVLHNEGVIDVFNLIPGAVFSTLSQEMIVYYFGPEAAFIYFLVDTGWTVLTTPSAVNTPELDDATFRVEQPSTDFTTPNYNQDFSSSNPKP